MLAVNRNYDDVLGQFAEARQLLLDPSISFLDQVKATKTFFGLISIVEDICHRTIGVDETEKIISPKVFDFLDQTDLNNYYRFLLEKDKHLRVFSSTYYALLDGLEDADWDLFLKTDNFFEEGDDKKFLAAFLESNHTLATLYQELKTEGRLFSFPTDSRYAGLTCFNLLREICNVFVDDKNTSFSDLSTLPHELGHVLDFNHSNKIGRNTGFGFYEEVLSNYFEQEFLFFFLENSKYKDQAFLSILHYYDKYLKLLQEGYYFSNLPSESLEEKFRNPTLFFMIEEELVKDGLLAEEEMSYSGRLTDFDSSIMYGYGFLLSTYLLENKDRLSEFMRIKNDDFSFSQLESIGFSSDSAVKSLQKRLDRTFRL